MQWIVHARFLRYSVPALICWNPQQRGVIGGGKLDHVGGSIVGLRLSTFRGNVRLSVQQKCHLSNPGSYQMSTAPVVRFAAAGLQ